MWWHVSHGFICTCNLFHLMKPNRPHQICEFYNGKCSIPKTWEFTWFQCHLNGIHNHKFHTWFLILWNSTFLFSPVVSHMVIKNIFIFISLPLPLLLSSSSFTLALLLSWFYKQSTVLILTVVWIISRMCESKGNENSACKRKRRKAKE